MVCILKEIPNILKVVILYKHFLVLDIPGTIPLVQYYSD